MWLNSETLNAWGCSVPPVPSQLLSTLSGSRGLSRQLRGQDPVSQPCSGGHILTVLRLGPRVLGCIPCRGDAWCPSARREGAGEKGERCGQRASPGEPFPSLPRAAQSCAKLGLCLSLLSLLPCSIHFGGNRKCLCPSVQTCFSLPAPLLPLLWPPRPEFIPTLELLSGSRSPGQASKRQFPMPPIKPGPNSDSPSFPSSNSEM